jgi:hypothetical protein
MTPTTRVAIATMRTAITMTTVTTPTNDDKKNNKDHDDNNKETTDTETETDREAAGRDSKVSQSKFRWERFTAQIPMDKDCRVSLPFTQ